MAELLGIGIWDDVLNSPDMYQNIILLMEKQEVSGFFGKLSHYSEVIHDLSICN